MAVIDKDSLPESTNTKKSAGINMDRTSRTVGPLSWKGIRPGATPAGLQNPKPDIRTWEDDGPDIPAVK